MPTKRQLSKMREAELEYPEIRRTDDLMLNSNSPSSTDGKPHVSGQLEAIRTDFCLWYYAQSQPLDANKVVDWFASNLR